MEAYLQSYPKKETMRLYKRGLNLFCEWYGKSIDAILSERKEDLTPRPKESLIDAKQRAGNYEKLLEQFYVWLIGEGYDKANTRYNYCKGLLQLFRYYNMNLTLRNQSPINQTNVKIDDFPLKPEHVKKMFHAAYDLRTKLWISLGNDLGWRISDVLSISRNELPNLNQETPIEWLRFTAKENQASKTCLSKTTVLLLKEYLETFPNPNNDLLFFNDNYNPVNPETVNMRLHDLEQDAKIETGNLSLTWHCFRKMIISTAKNLQIDPDIILLMTGKAVEKSMLPYLNGIDIKTSFIKLQTNLGLNALTESGEDVSKAMVKEVEKLGRVLSYVENENAISKIRIENLQKTQIDEHKQVEEMQSEFQLTKSQLADIIAKQQKKNEELEHDLETVTDVLKGLKPIIDNVDEVVEFLEKRREEKELQSRAEADQDEQAFREKVLKEAKARNKETTHSITK